MPVTLPSTESETQGVLTPIYNVVLLDDDDHTVEYVVEMLQRLFLVAKAQAHMHALEVHHTGRSVVLTAELPVASFAKEQIHGYGADWRLKGSKGSMSAILEPAGGEAGGGGGTAA
ncbi:MAG: ATP-dependent Clp protease adaptor ClpS [Bryobacteraceae bacterium]|nr:ATP-dependent Clp protease adaptor ClpS [Bryobacteraceae bacterium]